MKLSKLRKYLMISFHLCAINETIALSRVQKDRLEEILLRSSNINIDKLELIKKLKIPNEEIRDYFHRQILKIEYKKDYSKDYYLFRSALSYLYIFGDNTSLSILEKYYSLDADPSLISHGINSAIYCSNFNSDLILKFLNNDKYQNYRHLLIFESIVFAYEKNKKENNYIETLRLLKLFRDGINLPNQKKYNWLKQFNNYFPLSINKEIAKLEKENEKIKKTKEEELRKELDLGKNQNNIKTEDDLNNETEKNILPKTDGDKFILLEKGTFKSKIFIIFVVLFTIIFGGFAICKTRKKKNRKQDDGNAKFDMDCLEDIRNATEKR